MTTQSQSVKHSEKRGVRATYIGGPTALIEFAGLRFLTDPTFDPSGSEYTTPVYTLRKTQGPAIPADQIGAIDAVLLSHDHHFDNFDRSGHEVATRAATIITTVDGAGRLGGNAVGLKAWDTTKLKTPDGRTVRVTATPARHGPPDGDRGPVIGFVLELEGEAHPTVYFSGDTVWYAGVEEIAARFAIDVAFLNLGAARVKEVGPQHLTFTAAESVPATRAFPHAVIVPLHFEGWTHFSEGRAMTEAELAKADLGNHVRWLAPGVGTEV
jgi:L-ascorbate metabolism protein UlaG (beta-lactamase superfamily)